MSHEIYGQRAAGIEQQLIALGKFAARAARIILFDNVNKTAASAESDPCLKTLPQQRTNPENDFTTNKNLALISNCQAIFDAATKYQLNSAQTVIKPVNDRSGRSEYVAVGSIDTATLYLHRPAISIEAAARFPFWLQLETVSPEFETELPTLYYREYVIDRLGQLSARECIDSENEVLRALSDTEAAPLHEQLAELTYHRIVPQTETITQ